MTYDIMVGKKQKTSENPYIIQGGMSLMAGTKGA